MMSGQNALVLAVDPNTPSTIPSSLQQIHGLNWADCIQEENLVKFQPLNNNPLVVAAAGQTIHFTIPKHGLVNFGKGFLAFKLTVTKKAAAVSAGITNGMSNIFKGLRVKCGPQLSYEDEWGRFKTLEKIIEWDDREFDFSPMLGHDTIANRKINGLLAAQSYCLNLDMNVLSCMHWDMDLLGDNLEITFYMETPGTCIETDDFDGTVSYTLSEVYLWAHRIIEVESFKKKRQASWMKSPLHIPFVSTHYLPSTLAAAATSYSQQFNLAFKSIAKCYTCFSPSASMGDGVALDKFQKYITNATSSFQWKISGKPFPEEAVVTGVGSGQIRRWTFNSLGLWDGEHGIMGAYSHLQKYFDNSSTPTFLIVTDFCKHKQEALPSDNLIDGLDFSKFLGDCNFNWVGVASVASIIHNFLLINNVLTVDYVNRKVTVTN